jgi:hypothetical protein
LLSHLVVGLLAQRRNDEYDCNMNRQKISMGETEVFLPSEKDFSFCRC